MRRDVRWTSFFVLCVFMLCGRCVPAQTFGLKGFHKKVTLERRLPSIAHVDGTTFKVVVEGSGAGREVVQDLKIAIESLMMHTDSRLQASEAHPSAVITCRISSYDQPPPQETTQTTLTPGGKRGATPQQVTLQQYKGILILSVLAKDVRTNRTIVSDLVTAKFNQEYSPAGVDKGILHTLKNTASHLTKGGGEEDTPPTPVELREQLIHDAAMQVVSHFVTTKEPVEVQIAHGKGLDAVANMQMARLWQRSIKQLNDMPPFAKPEDDAYRLYDLGVANEALGYAADDPKEGLAFLEAASGFYGRAIDAKPLENNFMAPEARIETSIAHYKILLEPPPAAVPAFAPRTKKKSP